MARKAPLYTNRVAKLFRRIVRGAMVGRIGRVEPLITARMGDALGEWLVNVINDAMDITDLTDEKLEVRKQLLQGVRVIGRSSMLSLEGRIDVYPWIRPHEFGGMLFPENAQMLTIPMFHALRPDGTPKFKRATSWKRFGSFIYTPKGSERSYIAYKAANRELRILYLLIDKVEIPARLGINRMAERQLGDLLVQWGRIFLIYGGDQLIYNPWDRGPQ
jgi:hypothetical protein